MITLKEILTWSGGGLLLLLTVVQIAPIKIDPWSFLFGWLGKAFCKPMMKELEQIKTEGQETRKVLEKHIAVDNERAADGTRQRILRFNDEVMRQMPHTQEHYIEVLKDIDDYETYCAAHEEYENNRSVMAIENIKTAYAGHLKNNDFLK